MKSSGSRRILEIFLKIGLGIIALGYGYALFKIVLFKYGFSSDLRSLNLVPLSFLKMFSDGTALDVACKNILGNIAIFIPLGIFLSLPKHSRSGISILLCLGLSLCFELIQYLTGCGAADVDDLLLNTLGGAAGVLLYRLALGKLDAKLRLPFATLLFLMLFGIAGKTALYLYAPNMLPAEVVFQNEELLQGRDEEDCDLEGRCTGLVDGQLALIPDSPQEAASQAGSPVRYALAAGGQILLKEMSYQFSPNGNIQKTFVQYRLADEAEAEALLQAEARFADLWLDGNGCCDLLVLTVFPDAPTA